MRIDHVGSTAVPGLAAKPIIDMDIVVASPADVAPVIERLRATGYRWRGDLGVAGRESFKPPADPNMPRHHLYVVVENNRAHLDHWLLRDLLRRDETARDRYAALKRHNAEQADSNMDVYVAGKAPRRRAPHPRPRRPRSTTGAVLATGHNDPVADTPPNDSRSGTTRRITILRAGTCPERRTERRRSDRLRRCITACRSRGRHGNRMGGMRSFALRTSPPLSKEPSIRFGAAFSC